jgi:hypothetical protein
MNPRARKLRFLHTDVLMPLVVGGCIYLLWRAPTLLMFSWAAWLGLAGGVDFARAAAAPVSTYLPAGILFTLPDAAWVYAWTAHFGLLWMGERRSTATTWTMLGLVLAAGGEVGQLLGVVPGTFDAADLVAVFIAAGIAGFRLRVLAYSLESP